MHVHTHFQNLGFGLPKHQWGKGFATEIAKSLIDLAFSNQTILKVTAMVDQRNINSKSVLEKIGMKLLGTKNLVNSNTNEKSEMLEYEINK